ncbi:hypothetical protein D6827_00550 [Candidatus Parcubacteria bacterium]|nr:MAG: hypothetical protein D6827_00550 [Candidatus Parcubacteria bacterium]
MGLRVDKDDCKIFSVEAKYDQETNFLLAIWLIHNVHTDINLNDNFSFKHFSALEKSGGSLERKIVVKLKDKFILPTIDRKIIGHKGFGLIQMFHGYGKGKTSAGLGMAIRAAGAGKRVGIIYFDKGGSEHYSERKILDKIDNIDYFVTGRDRIGPDGKFDFTTTELDKKEAGKGLVMAQSLAKEGYDLLILDEINSTVDLGLLPVEEVVYFLDNKPKYLEVILTGRNPHILLRQRAHLITEMMPQKHYFHAGVKAREGLDY